MRKSIKHYLSIVLSAVVFIGIFAGFAPVTKVSAAAKTPTISNMRISNPIYTVDNKPVIYNESTWDKYYYFCADVQDLDYSDVIYIYVHKKGVSQRKDQYYVRIPNPSKTMRFKDIINDEPGISTSGNWVIEISVERSNKFIATKTLDIISISKKSEKFMRTLCPNSSLSKIVNDSLRLSTGSSARGIVRESFPTSLTISDRDFVLNMYTRILGRDADPSGYQYWYNRLAAVYNKGNAARLKERKAVLEDFIWTQEFKNRCATLNLTW